MKTFLVILFAALMFGFLITIHEFGHYLFARIFKVGIHEFSIGMGPKILSRRSKKTGILYSLRALPLGGYVSMVGEDEASDDENALSKKKAWQRLIIMAAGGLFNILVGILLSAVFVFMTLGSLGSTQVAQFEKDATSAYYLREGDIIKEVNGKKVGISSELSFRLMWEVSDPRTVTVKDENGESVTLENMALIDLTVIRDGEKLTIRDVPFRMATEEGIGLGQQDFYVYREAPTFGTVLRHIFCEVRSNAGQVWSTLGALFTGRVNPTHLSGPVGITQQMTQAASVGIEYLIYFAALIAVNLGIVNLLPVPALDGGRILFLLVEVVRGKPMRPEVEARINSIALMLLLGLSVFVLFKDIFNLF